MDRVRRPHATARSATALTVLSGLSPAAGVVVEMALAWRFGASATVDAFRISVLVVLVGQQLFVLLPNVIVPVFAAYRAKRAESEAWEAALSAANLLVVPSAVLALIVFVRPEPVVHLLGPGLDREGARSAVFFVRWFMVACVPLVWSGIIAGVLAAYDIFWLPAASQLLGNMVLVGMIVLCGRDWGGTSLVVGVLIASCASWALFLARLAALMHDVGVRPTGWFSARHPGVGHALRLGLPVLGAVLIGQWTAAVINRVLSHLEVGTLATFGYAWKMGQMVSLFPGALAAVLLPRFAESWHSSREGEFRETCTKALRMALFLALPTTCVFFVLRRPIVMLLFERGEFAAEAGEAVARLFGLLLLGAPGLVAFVYIQKMFYAVQAMWVPFWTQLGVAVLWTVLAPAVAARFAADGVALMCAALTWISCGALLVLLHRMYGSLSMKELAVFSAKVGPLAVISALLGGQGANVIQRFSGSGTWSLIVTIAAGVGLASVIFYGVTVRWGFPEALESQRYLHWQRSAMRSRLQSALHR